MLAIKTYRSTAPSLADLLHYAFLVNPGTMLLKEGSLMAVWRYHGPDPDSSGTGDLAALASTINSALARVGNGWLLHADCIRKPAVDYPAASRMAFPDRTNKLIDSERRRQYQQVGQHYESAYCLTLTWLPPSDNAQRAMNMLIDDPVRKEARTLDQHIETFERQIENITGVLVGRLKLERLEDDALLTYIHSAITGTYHPLALRPEYTYLDAVLGYADMIGGLKPLIGGKHTRVITTAGFPAAHYPGILSLLDRLPLTFRWSSRFVFMDQAEADNHLKSYSLKWFQKRHTLMDSVTRAFGVPATDATPNRHALRQTDDAEEAISENNDGGVRYGYYTVAVVVMEDNPDVADESAKMISNTLMERGFPARVETVNAIEAYLGSLPGHGHENIRRPLIHTLSLADLMPTTAVWPGPEYHPCPFYPEKSPPLLIASAADNTPMRLSLHVGSNGHTLIAGPVDAGKSTLLNLLMSSHLRYPGAEIIGFDYKNSAFALCEASGGTYYDILTPSQNVAEETPFLAPLLHVDDDGERAWAKDWIEDVLVLNGLTPTPAQRKKIRQALEKVAAADPDMRSLSAFITNVQDNAIKEALAYYQEGILDAESDSIQESSFTLFEMRHLMEHGPKLVVPTLLYMFRRITQRLKGQPVMIPMDEAWVVLAHELFAEKLAVWLRTIRSMNGHVVLATQSLEDAAKSSISHILRETCATKILLPNTHATDTQSIQFYRDMNLSDEQIEMLSMLQKKRHYFYTSDLGERVLDLTLGPVALAFVGATSMEDVNRVKSLKAEHGGTWPSVWLREKGLNDAAAEWEGMA
ncbi:hypothetical protein HF563_05180 [Acidithiobacillus ferridurans]|uniref:VirB4 family type IV secretion/conjugal transfer ATPase n=1 Tax=Acidithiobacillus ferridurans TaxID=1232575 RepID=UPI001C07742B|nr:conjugal transfer protein TrbE [Acidithiobacillus ferridurans]MBU2718779.1 hypothetical protein [Acidithiobacillus ferridurans]MBU2733478.1 hypothetical protein [Acidithiobacillus ferridurans]